MLKIMGLFIVLAIPAIMIVRMFLPTWAAWPAALVVIVGTVAIATIKE